MLLYYEECALSFWNRVAEAITKRVSVYEVTKYKAPPGYSEAPSILQLC
jgi:hypothetical protein